ncbi:CBS domain-containing protein [Peptostreptococcus equinus]|uniref:CBS domain-containing protein n=1 Tax=Peptostreptococcus equinus TaxID=3003601 RepID=A0ABY7JR95_9FIRM|nr:CBS domain-containing protein [Peptostreptococcus sp. CBA3647]WAW15664.1 CBS domain-containing protein [Peptostreptococcus sp. CBA3647]
MNILFFITPKSDVVSVKDTDSVMQVLKILKKHKYTSVPIINDDGNYVGTIKEGDLLWFLEARHVDNNLLNNTNIMQVPMRYRNETAKIDTNVEELFNVLIHQNFVPVIDDSNIFIGIIKRRDALQYAYNIISKELKEENL